MMRGQSSEWDMRGKRPSRVILASGVRNFGNLPAVVLAIAVFAMPAIAEPVSSLKPTGYVNDFAAVLSAATKVQLNETCRQLDQKAGAQIAIVAIKSSDGKDIFNYSIDLYQKWGIGQKGKDRGVLCMQTLRHEQRDTMELKGVFRISAGSTEETGSPSQI